MCRESVRVQGEGVHVWRGCASMERVCGEVVCVCVECACVGRVCMCGEGVHVGGCACVEGFSRLHLCVSAHVHM